MKITRLNRLVFIRLIGVLLSALSLCTVSFEAWADFTVKSPNQSSERYGNAENTAFYRAMHGAGLLSPEEQQEILDCLPEKEIGRYYGRLNIGFAQIKVTSIKNLSPAGGGFATGTLTRESAGQSGENLELAVGYIFDQNFRIEGELLTNRDINYSASPLFTNHPERRSYSASIKNTSLLANIYYDFTVFDRVKPYIMGSLGLANNRVVSALSGLSDSSVSRKLGVAYGLAVGARFGIFTRWFIDLKLRTLILSSKLKLQPSSRLILEGKYSLNSIGIGVMYLF